MNVVGVGAASVTGLLAVYLYLAHDDRVTEKQDEVAAEMRCQRAEFDADMAGKWNDSPEKIERLTKKAEGECGKFEAKRVTNETTRVERETDAKEMKESIGSLMK